MAERNDLQTAGNSEANGSRSDDTPTSSSNNQYDMVTTVTTKPKRCDRFHRTTTLENRIDFDHDRTGNDEKEPDVTQLMNVTTNVPSMIQKSTQKHKLLQAQVPAFKGQKERYDEVEQLLLNPLTPFQHKDEEDKKLHSFSRLLREDAIEFGQTIR